MMRLPVTAVLMAAAMSAAMAQSPPAPSEPSVPEMSARDLALENLLSERDSPAAFETVLADARKQGVGEQAILEARFLFHVDRREDDAIAALMPEFLKRADTFRVEDSAVFGVTEDWLAVIEYVRAIAALKKGDKDGFKKHITEAFWLSPRQGAAFAPHIDRLRMEEAMRAVKLDFKTTFQPMEDGPPVPLEKLMEGKKALLLHFWSPESQESEATLPDFIATATMLGKNGVAVVSLLPEDSAAILTKARAMIRLSGAKPPGAWMLDGKTESLATALRVRTLPSMALLSEDGRVLFNGHPSEDSLWEELVKIDPAIARPGLTEAPEKP